MTMRLALWSVPLTALALLGGACSDARPSGEVSTTVQPELVVVPPDQRISPDAPLLEIKLVCYGMCWSAQATPLFAVYDDRRIVRSGYRSSVAPFHLQGSELSEEDFQRIVGASTSAGLNRGIAAGVGKGRGADGVGYIFVSHLGVEPSVVEGRYLDYEAIQGEGRQREALRQLFAVVTDVEGQLEWEDLPVRWVMVGLHRMVQQGLVPTLPWPGPPIEPGEDGTCMFLGDVSGNAELERFISSTAATFSPAVSDGTVDWYVTPQALMPHQNDCGAVVAENAWYEVSRLSMVDSPSS